MPRTTEPLSRNSLDETFVRILRPDPHRREGTADASDARETHRPATNGARTFRFALGRLAEREHRPADVN
jgi:hypothetical protein